MDDSYHWSKYMEPGVGGIPWPYCAWAWRQIGAATVAMVTKHYSQYRHMIRLYWQYRRGNYDVPTGPYYRQGGGLR